MKVREGQGGPGRDRCGWGCGFGCGWKWHVLLGDK